MRGAIWCKGLEWADIVSMEINADCEYSMTASSKVNLNRCLINVFINTIDVSKQFLLDKIYLLSM